jgi:cytochrome c oxidase subunit 2
MKAAPLSYLDSAGIRASAILPLTYFTLLVSIIVCLVIALLLWMAVRRARLPGALPMHSIPIECGESGIRLIGIGLAVSALPLLVTLVWTMVSLAAIAGPPANPGLVLDVTAHQWWWEVRYNARQPADAFTTANEIHIPIRARVLVRLHAADVIHSFWVPKLSGKTDVIPGQTNLTWIEADRPGVYGGQCSEYCGLQHAHMAIQVIAENAEDFRRWQEQQLKPAAAPTTAEQNRGLSLVEYRCGLCHQVRGTTAGAISAPDLTHLMNRRTLAAGTLLNNSGNLIGWIENPQTLKPGSLMPDQHLSSQQLSDALAYLESLQ